MISWPYPKTIHVFIYSLPKMNVIVKFKETNLASQITIKCSSEKFQNIFRNNTRGDLPS